MCSESSALNPTPHTPDLAEATQHQGLGIGLGSSDLGFGYLILELGMFRFGVWGGAWKHQPGDVPSCSRHALPDAGH